MLVSTSLRTSLENKKPAKPYDLRVFVLSCISLDAYLVPMAGFEPARLASPPPQDGVSTNFTTSA
jgi:hypothetical protein